MNDVPVVHEVIGEMRDGAARPTYVCPICGAASATYAMNRDVEPEYDGRTFPVAHKVSKWRFTFGCGHTVQIGKDA